MKTEAALYNSCPDKHRSGLSQPSLSATVLRRPQSGKRLPRAPGRARVRGMTNQIHGHEVMQMMVEAQTAYSVESLKAAIIGKFGADARFYTCSADNLTADDLIGFLAQRGKFVAQADGFSTSADKICNH